jgi:hypothetical protein
MKRMKNSVLRAFVLLSLHTVNVRSMEAPSVDLFSSECYPIKTGSLPSESSAIPINQKNILFGPKPKPIEEEEITGTDVGSAPVDDHLRMMVICTIVYALCIRKRWLNLSEPRFTGLKDYQDGCRRFVKFIRCNIRRLPNRNHENHLIP